MPQHSPNIPSIDSAIAIDQSQITHLEDWTMEAFVCQVTDLDTIETLPAERAEADLISTLTSTEMSFVGGGTMVAVFA